MAAKEKTVTRREFALRAALGAASASLLPFGGPLGEPFAGPFSGIAPIDEKRPARDGEMPISQAPPQGPTLSAQSQMEAESRWKAIVDQYGDRFTDAQKADLKRLCVFVQPSLDRIRAHNVGNSDLPGLYLKPLVDRDKKPVVVASSTKSAAPAKSVAPAAPGKP